VANARRGPAEGQIAGAAFEATPWYIPRVQTYRNAILIGLLSLGLACKEKPSEEAPAPGVDTKTPDKAKGRTTKSAMGGEFSLTTTMLVLDAPVAAAALGHGSLRPEPIAGTALSELREAYEKATPELDGVDVDALDGEARGVVAALRFAHARVAEKLGEQNPARSDLGYAVGAAQRFLDEAEYEVVRGEGDCKDGLKALGEMLTAAGKELGASSLESLEAAQQDLGALRARIQALPTLAVKEDPALGDAIADAIAALDGLADLTGKRLAALASAELGAWGQPITPAGDGTALRRLPAVLGVEELRRRLELEEGMVVERVEDVLEALLAGVARIETLADEKKLRLETPSKGGGSRVDKARCDSLASPIRGWAKAAKRTKVKIDCDAIVRKYGGAKASQAEIGLEIMDSGVLEPTRNRRREKAKLPMSLVSGNILPTSQRDAAAIAMLLAAGTRPAMERAVQRALKDACLSAAALWYHAELGGAARLRKKLDGHCAWKKPSAWLAEAASRPRRSLGGLGFVISGKTGIARMNSLWWVPLGLPRIMNEAAGAAQSVGPPPADDTGSTEVAATVDPTEARPEEKTTSDPAK